MRQERLKFLWQARQFGGGGEIPDPATHVIDICGGKYVEESYAARGAFSNSVEFFDLRGYDSENI